jgi:hypothetical protein
MIDALADSDGWLTKLGALMVITDATALTAESRCFSAMMNWKISRLNTSILA